MGCAASTEQVCVAPATAAANTATPPQTLASNTNTIGTTTYQTRVACETARQVALPPPALAVQPVAAVSAASPTRADEREGDSKAAPTSKSATSLTLTDSGQCKPATSWCLCFMFLMITVVVCIPFCRRPTFCACPARTGASTTTATSAASGSRRGCVQGTNDGVHRVWRARLSLHVCRGTTL